MKKKLLAIFLATIFLFVLTGGTVASAASASASATTLSKTR